MICTYKYYIYEIRVLETLSTHIRTIYTYFKYFVFASYALCIDTVWVCLYIYITFLYLHTLKSPSPGPGWKKKQSLLARSSWIRAIWTTSASKACLFGVRSQVSILLHDKLMHQSGKLLLHTTSTKNLYRTCIWCIYHTYIYIYIYISTWMIDEVLCLSCKHQERASCPSHHPDFLPRPRLHGSVEGTWCQAAPPSHGRAMDLHGTCDLERQEWREGVMEAWLLEAGYLNPLIGS